MVWMELLQALEMQSGVTCCDVGMGLRRSHAALLDDQLADLETDAAVVCSLGDESWRVWLASVQSVAIPSLRGEEWRC